MIRTLKDLRDFVEQSKHLPDDTPVDGTINSFAEQRGELSLNTFQGPDGPIIGFNAEEVEDDED